MKTQVISCLTFEGIFQDALEGTIPLLGDFAGDAVLQHTDAVCVEICRVSFV